MNFDLWNEKSKVFSKCPLTPKHDLFSCYWFEMKPAHDLWPFIFLFINLRRMTFDLWSYHTVIWFRRQTTVRDVQPCKELNTLIKIHLCAQVSIHFELSHFFDWYSMLFTRHMSILIWSSRKYTQKGQEISNLHIFLVSFLFILYKIHLCVLFYTQIGYI